MRKRPKARKLASEISRKTILMTNGMKQDISDYSDVYREYETYWVQHALHYYMTLRIKYEDQKLKHGDNIADTFELWLEDII